MRISDWSSDVCSSDLHIGVKRRIGRKAVEAAAPHIEKLVDQHVTYGAQFTRITRLTQDTRYRVAAAIAKGREIDLHKRNPIEVRQKFPHVLAWRSEEHTSEIQSLMRISYAVFCLKKKTSNKETHVHNHNIR